LVSQVRAALGPSLAEFARLGRAVSRSWITTRLHVSGIASVRYTDPAAPAEVSPIAANEYPVLGLVQLTDGGVE
jgi:phage-related baseplate assembly protein